MMNKSKYQLITSILTLLAVGIDLTFTTISFIRLVSRGDMYWLTIFLLVLAGCLLALNIYSFLKFSERLNRLVAFCTVIAYILIYFYYFIHFYVISIFIIFYIGLAVTFFLLPLKKEEVTQGINQTNTQGYNNDKPKGQQAKGIISTISALFMLGMMFFPIGMTDTYKKVFGQFQYYIYVCSGFSTLIFSNSSFEVLDFFAVIFGILNWILVLTAVALIALNVISLACVDGKIRHSTTKITPVLATIVATLYLFEGIVGEAMSGTSFAFIPFFIEIALLIVAFFLNYKFPVEDEKDGANQAFYKESNQSGYTPFSTHVICLLFVPFWYYIWVYRATVYLNRQPNNEWRNPTNKLLLCLFVPFYSVYWTYKSALAIDKLAQSKGISSDLGSFCPILSVFIGVIPPILMQQKINEIETRNTVMVQPQPNSAVQPVQSNLECAEEIKKYKELLDCGAITQEEYDRKKTELLGF